MESEQATPADLHPSFFNREISWIQFNSRVLEEALNPSIPLLERLKFLSIFSTNLDEFFMVRISGLQEQLEASPTMLSPDGLTPAAQLKQISEYLRPLIERQWQCLLTEILPGLEKAGVKLVSYQELTETERTDLKKLFYDRVFPVLTPLTVDPTHPFPYISNISLNLGVLLAIPGAPVEEKPRFARVKIPPNVPRLIPVDNQRRFLLLEELIGEHIASLFPHCPILECQPFRITRDADIEIEEDEAEDLMASIEQTLRRRRFGFGVRLEVAGAMSAPMIDLLCASLDLVRQDVYAVEGPLNIPDLMALYKLDIPDAKDKPFEPIVPALFRTGDSIFDVLKTQDILLHHPYESFLPVVEFLRAAALDPNVLAIKQTLYRVGPDSPIVSALIDAAERGKQVAVLVELKARFDEENNIQWAKRLERAGAHVVYGVVGLKTHAKLALVVRKEGSGFCRYVHLGTGNYNPATARLYTDLGLFTSNTDFGHDCSEFFNYLTGYSGQTVYRKLVAAPVGLRDRVVHLIRREALQKASGQRAGIVAQFNSLTDTAIIEELYAASAAGVPITLIVRGVCCLRPGVPGRSENIRVASIVGRFLEHLRVYLFTNDGNEEVYLSSADIMHRNLDRRVELMFPVEDPHILERIHREVIENALNDTQKIRWLQPDGSYLREMANSNDGPPYDSQAGLIARFVASESRVETS
jgi:polyphosphate kinase